MDYPTEVMVDIETMSTNNSRALILSVGMVKFKLTPEEPIALDQRMWVPELAEQILLGRIVTPKTQAWWANQKPEASAHFMPGPAAALVQRHTMRMMLGEIKDFVGDSTVLANGIVFDGGNLIEMAQQLEVPEPWYYNQIHDYRTLVRRLPKLRSRPEGKENSNAHDPIADCINQIWGLWEVTRFDELT